MKHNYRNRYKYDVKQACIDAGFKLSKSFRRATNKEITDNWNNIGASGKWYNRFIPKTIWGRNIELASAPHDWEYTAGKIEAEKQRADKNFFYNIKMICKKQSSMLMYRIRRVRAYGYYLAVKHGGYNAFWQGKKTRLNLSNIVLK